MGPKPRSRVAVPGLASGLAPLIGAGELPLYEAARRQDCYFLPASADAADPLLRPARLSTELR